MGTEVSEHDLEGHRGTVAGRGLHLADLPNEPSIGLPRGSVFCGPLSITPHRDEQRGQHSQHRPDRTGDLPPLRIRRHNEKVWFGMYGPVGPEVLFDRIVWIESPAILS